MKLSGSWVSCFKPLQAVIVCLLLEPYIIYILQYASKPWIPELLQAMGFQLQVKFNFAYYSIKVHVSG